MICPNCRSIQPSNALNCSNCRAFLPQPSSGKAPSQQDSPFGDYLPAWMSAQTPQVEASAAYPAAPPIKSAPPSGGLGFSLDELLGATETNLRLTPTSANPNQPGSAPGATASISVDDLAAFVPSNWASGPTSVSRPPAVNPVPNTWATPQATLVHLPMPPFEQPPTWTNANPSTAQAYAGATSGPAYTPAYVPNQPPVSDEPEVARPEAEFGVDRGFYYYRDGETEKFVLLELGDFLSKVWGAVVDAIVMGVLIFLLYIVLSIVLLASLLKDTNRFARYGNDYATREAANSFFWTVVAVLVLVNLIPYLYNVCMVALGGQTLGHRIAGIKVISQGGGSVGIGAALARAVYGIIPGLVSLIIQLTLVRSVLDTALEGGEIPLNTGYTWYDYLVWGSLRPDFDRPPVVVVRPGPPGLAR